MSKVTTVAVDLGKEVFQIGFADRHGREVRKQRRLTSRDEFRAFVAEVDPRCEVLMEVGWGAQGWARAFRARNIRVRLLPAQQVIAHRTGAKNDRNDVLAILRAGQDASIHAVPVKSAEDQAIQAEHRVRRGWVRRRTAISNQVRGLLADQGMVFAKGDAAFVNGAQGALEDASLPIPDRLRVLIQALLIEWHQLGARVHESDANLERLVRDHPIARMLQQELDGVGPIGAPALACKAVELDRFADARHFAASFGLVPEQHSSSDRIRLGRMSKRGDSYIRATLVSGAMAVFRYLPMRPDNPDTRRLQRWHARHGTKGAAIRLANRNLRIAFSLMRSKKGTST